MNPQNRDTEKYHFYNKELYIKEYCTAYELYSRYNVPKQNVHNMIKGLRKSVNGWTILYRLP